MRWVLSMLMHRSLWSLAKVHPWLPLEQESLTCWSQQVTPVQTMTSDPGTEFHELQLNSSEDNEGVIRVSQCNENPT